MLCEAGSSGISVCGLRTLQTVKCSTGLKKVLTLGVLFDNFRPHTETQNTNKHMRTKTLLLTAALFAAGIAASMAQVYSVNSVGYVNKTLVTGYSLISNPLNGTNNLLSTILPAPPDGTSVLKWDPAAQGFSSTSPLYIDGLGWLDDMAFNPGEGFFVSNPGSSVTVTFVGEVPQGSLTNGIAGGAYTLLANVVPQAIALDAPEVNFPALDGDSVLLWNPAAQTFSDVSPLYIDGLGWLPSAPLPAVGEGFFLSSALGAPRSWVRTFSVNN